MDAQKEIEEIDKVLEYSRNLIASLEERKSILQGKIEEKEVKEESDEIERLDAEEEVKEDKSAEEFEREQLIRLKEKPVKFSNRQRTVNLENTKINSLRKMINPASRIVDLDKLKNTNVMIEGASPVTIGNDKVESLRVAINSKGESLVEQILEDSPIESVIPAIKTATM